MAKTITHKQSSVVDKVPLTSDLIILTIASALIGVE